MLQAVRRGEHFQLQRQPAVQLRPLDALRAQGIGGTDHVDQVPAAIAALPLAGVGIEEVAVQAVARHFVVEAQGVVEMCIRDSYNDYLQRNAIREDLESYLREMGDVTSSNIQNWLGGRLLLVEQTAQTLARDHSPETVSALLEQPALTSTFSFTYLGQQDGVFTMRPDLSLIHISVPWVAPKNA